MIVVRNKKGQLGHALTWLYKFLIIVVVVGGVVFIVLNHYSRSYDIRDAEASILAKKLVECIAPDGIVKEFSNETVKNCFLIDEKEHYLNVTLGEDSIATENELLITLCQAMKENVRIKKPPACHHSQYLVLNKGKLSELDIFIAIRKLEKNV